MHVTHPLLKAETVEFRGYQANLARIAQKDDTLVVLPTGMGKTIVALLAIADALQGGAKRILLLAPTRPLVEQHAAFFGAVLAAPWGERVQGLTGTQTPEKRARAYASEGLVCATPQVIQNDMVGGRLDLSTFDWVVFDEAHRAVGDYPYAFIGTELQRRHPKGRRLGLTASPGHDVRKIDEVRQNLGLAHVEIRTPADADVAPYVQTVQMEWETLPLPPTMARVSAKLQEALAERVRTLKGLGILKTAGSKPNRRELLELAGILQAKITQAANPDPSLYQGLSLQAQALKIQHAIEQVETQGSAAFIEYMEGVRAEAASPKASKASRSIAEDPRINEAYHVARFDTSETPKLARTGVLVREFIASDPAARCIVFTHYRSTCEVVAGHLAKLPGVRPVVFVGQGKRGGQEGMSQKSQKETLDRFRAGEVNVLVATSVAEEGLDIPDTDLVVFFEPIPSEIRAIQRRGRTGRQREGRVVVLMTKGTQDEAAHWSARRKEQEMVREMHNLRATIGKSPLPAVGAPLAKGQRTLESSPAAPANGAAKVVQASSPATGPKVLFDHREQSGAVVRHLHEMGCTLEARQLDIADFILSDRVAVERKTCADFVDSLVDGRLFEQMRQLKSYPRPFLVLEGESLHGHRSLSPEAILGAVASVTVDYGIPILQTRDGLETARFLHAAAKREQEREGRKLAVRPGKPASDEELRLFLVCGLPGISEVLGQRLLEAFGTPERVFAASAQELSEVEGIGGAKASEIRRILATAGRALRASAVRSTETA
ncbi:MAG TPA: DEAD/DEAH box helicase [Candidatus Thermoplasmatota archaeon]|nr:DEAD/DEAH box helicase [Candidatus Thermoplasmatota archaeon]